MADRYRTADGWSVEVVRLTGTPDRHDGEWFRLRYLGYHVHDVRSIAELARYVPLAELEEALAWPQVQAHVLVPAFRAVAQPQTHQPADPLLGDYLLEGLIEAIPGQHGDRQPALVGEQHLGRRMLRWPVRTCRGLWRGGQRDERAARGFWVVACHTADGRSLAS